MEDTLFRGNREPTLDQILAEPIVQTMMRRDGVEEETLRRLMRRETRAVPPANPPKLRIVAPSPPPEADTDSPQPGLGVLAQATAGVHWPRVFPSL